MGAPVGLTVKMPVGAPVAVLAEAPVVADTLGVPGLGLVVEAQMETQWDM